MKHKKRLISCSRKNYERQTEAITHKHEEELHEFQKAMADTASIWMEVMTLRSTLHKKAEEIERLMKKACEETNTALEVSKVNEAILENTLRFSEITIFPHLIWRFPKMKGYLNSWMAYSGKPSIQNVCFGGTAP